MSGSGNDPWGPPPPQQPPQQQPQQAWPGAPQGPPPQQWPQPAPLVVGSSLPKSDKPVLALVFAILSFVLCGCFSSLPALVLAKMELGSIERGETSPEGKGVAQAAFWVAAANVGLHVLVGIVYVVILIVALATR